MGNLYNEPDDSISNLFMKPTCQEDDLPEVEGLTAEIQTARCRFPPKSKENFMACCKIKATPVTPSEPSTAAPPPASVESSAESSKEEEMDLGTLFKKKRELLASLTALGNCCRNNEPEY